MCTPQGVPRLHIHFRASICRFSFHSRKLNFFSSAPFKSIQLSIYRQNSYLWVQRLFVVFFTQTFLFFYPIFTQTQFFFFPVMFLFLFLNFFFIFQFFFVFFNFFSLNIKFNMMHNYFHISFFRVEFQDHLTAFSSVIFLRK